jgi:uncharacterized protein (DUF433 family)
MEWNHYFDFLGPNEIRIKGTRVGIEFVLQAYLEGAGPEEIVLRYPTLSLEQVHATITYYLGHQEAMQDYLARWWQEGEEAWQQQQHHPSDFVRALRERLQQQRRQLQGQGGSPWKEYQDRLLFLPL